MVSHAGAVQDVTEGAVPRFAAILAAVLPVGLLVQVLGELRDYRHPAVPVAVWLSLLAAAWCLIPQAGGGGLTRRQAAVAVAVALAAVSAVGWDRRPHVPAGALDWSILGAVWLLALAAVSRPAWEWVQGRSSCWRSTASSSCACWAALHRASPGSRRPHMWWW
jgi:hypothetical protein